MGLCRTFKTVLTRLSLLLLINGACNAFLSSADAATVNLTDFGAYIDNTHPQENVQAFNKAVKSAGNSGTINVPAGTYAIDNSAQALVAPGFSGQIIFDPNAKFLFTNNVGMGLSMVGGVGARFLYVHYGYENTPTQRTQPGFVVANATDTLVDHLTVDNAPGPGLQFGNVVRPVATNILIQNTMADGLDFFDCKDGAAAHVVTQNTGDDGLAFVHYAGGPFNTGGTATDISINNSEARGISVIGYSDVSISSFTVNGTFSSGILVASDTYTNLMPQNVSFANGTILNAGTVPPLPNTNLGANHFGIEYNEIISAQFSNINVAGSQTSGFAGVLGTTVQADHITVTGNQSGPAVSLSAQNVTISNIIVNGSPSYGIYVGHSGQVTASNLKVTDANGTMNRSVWFEANQNVAATGISIIDDQATPTGFVFGGYSNGSGTASNICGAIAHGSLQITQQQSGMSFTTPGLGSACVTISPTVDAAPIFTSPATAYGIVGHVFAFLLTAFNLPTNFDVDGLPADFSFQHTGLIEGTPTASGVYKMTVTASNNIGATSTPFMLVISGADGAQVATQTAPIQVFPNPWRNDKNAGHKIMFTGLPANATVKLFTISGHLVKSLGSSAGVAQWDLTNDSNDKVASGVYLYLITDNGGTKIHGKLAIIK